MGIGPGKGRVMFGGMMVTPIAQVGTDVDLQTEISSLLRAAEQADIVRWIEFPNSVLLFLLVPGDPESGAVYILDRNTGSWYSVDFDDKQYGGYSVSQLEQLLKGTPLFRPCRASMPVAWQSKLVGGSGQAARSPRLTEKRIMRVINLHAHRDVKLRLQ